jgi:hypothetical protein
MNARLSTALVYAAIGAAPGIVLVLVAQFVIDGEMELTVGAPGFLLAAAGAIAGLIFGGSRPVDGTRSRQ